MQEVGEALAASIASLEAARTSCESAASELWLINDENSAQEVEMDHQGQGRDRSRANSRE
jgi:hypothetical protein